MLFKRCAHTVSDTWTCRLWGDVIGLSAHEEKGTVNQREGMKNLHIFVKSKYEREENT